MGMYRRHQPDAGHEQHDALLIAQYAARDPLTAEQVAQAAALVGSCGECASLSTDLGAISNAVAAEPLPRRRRDFRLDADTAAELRGSPLTRLMRRLTMPGSAPLRPLAAGVMSIGLVFVIAGNIVPTAEESIAVVPGAAVELQGLQETVGNVATDLDDFVADGETQAQAAGTPGPDARRRLDIRELEGNQASPPPVGSALGSKRVRAEVGVVGVATAPGPVTEALDGGVSGNGLGQFDEQAGRLRRDEAAGDEASELNTGFADDLTPSTPTENELDGGRDQDVQKSATSSDNVADPAAGAAGALLPLRASPIPGRAVDGPGDAALAPDSAPALGVAAEVDVGGGVAFRSVAEPTDDAIGVLIPLGVGLTIAGSLALLLLWFARRANPDPLRT
jgi:hypothetical protein